MHKLQTKHKDTSDKAQVSSYRDLEDRTTEFAKREIKMCKALPVNEINRRLAGQIVRSAGSVGANYREANEAMSKKDFIYRVRISRKEAKETGHWLDLIAEANPSIDSRLGELRGEAVELRKIFSSMITRSSQL